MSTTGAFGFRVDERDKVSFYGHDSYPLGLGLDLLRITSRFDITELKKIVRGIDLIPEDDYTHNLLNWGDSFLNTLSMEGRKMADGNKHLLKPNIEWAYIINLDNEVFESYSGLNIIRGRNFAGRYSKQSLLETPHIPGVRLLDNLPLIVISGMDDKDMEGYMENIDKLMDRLMNKAKKEHPELRHYGHIESRWKRLNARREREVKRKAA
ncbi:hypothetical protein HYT24_03220 [Candidatus Pacearchaeota archaeon]|nr:hypothetical protein [Candidatus Pacearchaeota archaeon]